MISSSISKKGESIGIRELNQKINLIDTKWDSFEDKINKISTNLNTIDNNIINMCNNLNNLSINLPESINNLIERLNAAERRSRILALEIKANLPDNLSKSI